MTVDILPDRNSPYPASFTLKAEQDVAASAEKGHFVARNVEIIRIRTGEHSEIEREIKPTDKNIYKNQYEAWKDSLEPPKTGTAIKDWCALSPSDIVTLLHHSVKTIEELSVLPDDVCSKINPSCRAWRSKSVAWLEAAASTGKYAEKINAFKIEIKQLRKHIEDRDESIRRLTEKLAK